MKKVNKTILIGHQQTDNVSFGGKTFRIDVDRPSRPAISENYVRLAETCQGGKVIGAFETFELI